MAKEKREEIQFPSLDELFSSQEEREDAKLKRIYEIPLTKIDPFPDHPYKVRDDEDMMNLVESVRINGIITPATVRKKEDGRYELLSGHRRKRACELAGLPTLRCDVVEMDRDEATVFMVESNFQRTTILPSEKAFAYKMRLEAMNRQGKRSDLTFSPLDKKLRSGLELSKDVGDSQAQIYRYIRLTELIPDILELVDEGNIALRPAVELSYIPSGRHLQLHRHGAVHSYPFSGDQDEKNGRGKQTDTGIHRGSHAGGEAQPEGAHRLPGRPDREAISKGPAAVQKGGFCCGSHGTLQPIPAAKSQGSGAVKCGSTHSQFSLPVTLPLFTTSYYPKKKYI